MLAIPYSERFPHTKAAADQSAQEHRFKKIQDGPISADWDMDAHLVALKARLPPMRTIGMGLLSSAIRVYKVLWPGCEAPAIVDELAKCLMASEERLDDWRSSAARVGADEVLTYVLSWYEGIDLDMLRTLRDGSKWTTDPDLIRRRQDVAHSLIQYAPVHSFVPGERVPQAEEIKEAGEEEEEDDDIDEEIQADSPPGTAETTTEEPARADTAPSAPSSTDPAA